MGTMKVRGSIIVRLKEHCSSLYCEVWRPPRISQKRISVSSKRLLDLYFGGAFNMGWFERHRVYIRIESLRLSIWLSEGVDHTPFLFPLQ